MHHHLINSIIKTFKRYISVKVQELLHQLTKLGLAYLLLQTTVRWRNKQKISNQTAYMLMENKILIIWNKPIHKTQEHAEQDEYTGSKDKGKK